MTGLVSLAAGQFNLDGVFTGTNTWEAGADLVGTNVLYGTLSWSSGSWQEATSVTVAAGAALLANAGGGTNYLGCPFTNYGTFDWAGGGLSGKLHHRQRWIVGCPGRSHPDGDGGDH